MNYRTIRDIKKANKNNGGHFFEKGALSFFQSKVYDEVYQGKYFITSERFQNEATKYTVRQCDEEGDISTVGKFQAYQTLDEAVSAINLIAFR